MFVSHTDICADVSYGMYATRHGLNEEQLGHLWTNLGIFVASCLRCGKVQRTLICTCGFLLSQACPAFALNEHYAEAGPVGLPLKLSNQVTISVHH